MNVKVFIATHKEFNYDYPNCYYPILVGSYNKEIKKYIRDDEGSQNISNKNKNYCELTGLYWIWKNDQSDIIGLCHYRRFFVGHSKNKLLTEKEIKTNLIDKQYDIILPKKWYYKSNVYSNYKEHHYPKDLDNCRKIILELYPDYVESFDYVMNRKYAYLYNMFIAKKKLMDKYFEWLFSIFERLEKCTNLEEYDDYQKRIYGFLSERLFNVWIEKNHLNIKEIAVKQVGRSWYDSFIVRTKCILKKILYSKSRKK